MSPELTVIAALRYAAFALGGYLALLVTLTALARVTRVASLTRLADALAPAVIGVLFGLPTVATAQTPTTDPPVVMHQLSDTAPMPPATVTASPPPVQPTTQPTWTIQPGQHFWAVAEHLVTDRLGRPPTDAEIVPYWHRLIEANRDRLRDRNNPDLVFPSQVLVLPNVS
jgi:hypothetical protein